MGCDSNIEVPALERRQLDLEAGTLRLEPGTTKSDDGRVVHLTAELKAPLVGQMERVGTLDRSRMVFDRYHIVSPSNLRKVARRLTGAFLGTMPPNAPDSLHVSR